MELQAVSVPRVSRRRRGAVSSGTFELWEEPVDVLMVKPLDDEPMLEPEEDANVAIRTNIGVIPVRVDDLVH